MNETLYNKKEEYPILHFWMTPLKYFWYSLN